MSNRTLFAAILAAFASAGLAGPAMAAPATQQAIEKYGELCHQAARATERRLRMPSGLLGAIALAESGRWNEAARESFAWPWTVTSGKDSWYLRDRAEALARVKALQAAGVSNIDVGCMQVNLHYHPDAFPSLEAAFDPAVNAAYAGQFLRGLRDKHRSWHMAIQRYHSSDPDRYIAYRRKVVNLWNDVRQRIGRQQRAAAIEAYRERRAEAQRLQAHYERVSAGR
ncbi:MAG: hypothetical protein WD270_03035 [Acetobacterales bacterium]